MKYKKNINFVMRISITLTILISLVACASESLSQNDYVAIDISIAESVTEPVLYESTLSEPILYESTLSEPILYEPTLSEPIPYTPPDELDIPDYITFHGRQFSTELTELNLSRWFLSGSYDITPLRYMVNLTSLDLNYNFIPDLSPLAGLTNLTELRLIGNQSTDLTPLGTLINLTTLELSLRYFDETDISPLIGLTGLTSFRLSLGGNQAGDISRLADLTTLTRLELWHNRISDLTPLEGLTNLIHIDLAGGNSVTDIRPIANLTNLNSLFLSYSPGMDLSYLSHVPPNVSSPVVSNAPADPHPFAETLTSFFVNLTTPGEWWMSDSSYHAVLVDVDGQGTLGMVASRWTFDGDRNNHSASSRGSIFISPSFTQKLFFMYDNQLHEVEGRWGVTPSGRVVRLLFDGICDMGITDQILLSVDDGRLVGEKIITIISTTLGYDSYSINYYLNGVLFREHQQNLTQAEFDELMEYYGLRGITFDSWDLPDDTYKILMMSSS